MTRRPIAAAALAVLIGPASAAGLPRESGEACHARTLALEEREPEAEPPRLADDPACRAFVAALAAVSDAAAPTTSDAVLDALALYGESPGHGPVVPVDRTRLEAMLAEIRRANDKPPQTAWQRFVRWLRESLRDEREQGRGPPAWLRWLSGIPPEAVRVLWWSLFTVMAGSLAWIVIRELRAADAFSRRAPPGRRVRAAADDAHAASRPHTLVEIREMPPTLQAAALLRSAIAHLRGTRRLPPDDSLTNGELRERLVVTDPSERRLFADIVRAAEAQVYGGSPPAEDRLRTLIDDAARTRIVA